MKLLNDFFLLDDTQTADGVTSCALRLNPHHVIFRAHFPGNPITPGVCIIQMVGELLERLTGRRLALRRVVNVKFQHVLSPAEHPSCRVTFRSVEPEGNRWKVKAVVTAEEIQFAQLSMIFEELTEHASEIR